ncbi:MAG: RsmB/NOP family class I SAM-dependent RNA methyltransferase [Synergistaceae bacterium]|nr:RsmB/NOP family class I SAM-dependent RNA methyltransferase [Synergistaceae bacterium]
MRGIEAALKILCENKNSFASENLRKLADSEKMKSTDVSLASSLIYIFMRRRELWQKIMEKFVRSKEKLPVQISTAILMGTGGLMELRRFSEGVLINGIVEAIKKDKRNQKYVSLVNAVLKKIKESGAEIIESLKKSSSLDDRALIAGVPVWFLSAWLRGWSKTELNEIFEMFTLQSYSSVRTQEPEKILAALKEKNINVFKSDISRALRIDESIFPVNLPGFAEGLSSVQSESSIIAASLVKKFYSGEGLILDMCSGRGVKAGQILEENQSSNLECWELSSLRSNSAKKELERLHVNDRAKLKIGDALELTPDETPSFIILDAPCSGSGTWNRKPESKWQLSWKKFDAITETQKKLLDRALNLIKSGGYVLYVTCSLLRQENENVVAEALAAHKDCVEVSKMINNFTGNAFKKGKPYGFYIMPCNSWLDGFYVSLIMKK